MNTYQVSMSAELRERLDNLTAVIQARESEVVEFAHTTPSDSPQRIRANELSYTYWEARSSIRKLIREIEKAAAQESAL